jgi:hypothetical protein
MPVNPPQTASITSHALTIKTGAGIVIGLIKQWQPKQDREVTPIYEINSLTSGEPVENVPGNVKGLQITVQRYDLYTKKMELAFGTSELTMLSLQDRPFLVQEIWRFPDNSLESYMYSGCYFSTLGKQYASDDNRTVVVNATLVYTRKDKIA